jgi:hypothetical protein
MPWHARDRATCQDRRLVLRVSLHVSNLFPKQKLVLPLSLLNEVSCVLESRMSVYMVNINKIHTDL